MAKGILTGPATPLAHEAWSVADVPPGAWSMAASCALGAAIALGALAWTLFVIWDIRLAHRILTGRDRQRQIEEYAARRGRRPPTAAATEETERARIRSARMKATEAGTVPPSDGTRLLDGGAHEDATIIRPSDATIAKAAKPL